MAYEPPLVWIEVRADGRARRVHGARECGRIRFDSRLEGPVLVGVAASGRSTSVCRCVGDHQYGRRDHQPRWQVSGGSPTLGRRR